MTARQLAEGGAGTPEQGMGRVRQLPIGGTRILQFPLSLIVTEPLPRCLWCRHEFTPSKPNQLYCKRKHSQYACDCRKAKLGTALAALLERHGASPQRAQDAAVELIEGYYASGRVQRAVEAFGWMYDEVGKEWRIPA